MSFTQYVSSLIIAFASMSAFRPTLFLTLAMLAFCAQALSPSQVFDKVKDSVVVVRTLDVNNKIIGQGSGVLLPSGKIGTNCHVVKNVPSIHVGSGKQFVPATLWGGDEDKDLCLLESAPLTAKPTQLGHAVHLKVGEAVYAVGAPRGLELSLSDGIVSQLRGGPPPFIQTTAAISPGSSGGGLFDSEGRLVGFTTLYIEGGQSLNFAMPVEWAGEIQPGMKAAQGGSRRAAEGRSWEDWDKRAKAFEVAKNWTGMRNWCQRWTQAQSRNIFGWLCLSTALGELKRYTEAIEAGQQALRINPESTKAWTGLGNAYRRPELYVEAIDAYRQAIRLDPRDISAWLSLGDTYSKLRRHAEAIDAYRQLVRIDPNDVIAWQILAISYEESGNRTEALETLKQLRRIDPVEADKAIKAMASRSAVNGNPATVWVKVDSTRTDTVYADRSTIRRKGNMVTMWDLMDFKSVQVIDKSIKPYLSMKTQSEYDCEEDRRRALSLSLHSENMSRGNVIHADSLPGEWTPVAPGSKAKVLWLVACR